jgi:polyisoprenoid-binding protein YceI
VGAADYKVLGALTIRGVTRQVRLDLHYLGKWRTPYWTEAGNAGTVTRVGFVGEAHLNRQDFQVSWNGELEDRGVVVSDEIHIQVDVEALLEAELNALRGGATA